MTALAQYRAQDKLTDTDVVNEVGTKAALQGGNDTIDLSELAGPGGTLPRALHFDGSADFFYGPLTISDYPLMLMGWINTDDLGSINQYLVGVASTSASNQYIALGLTNTGRIAVIRRNPSPNYIDTTDADGLISAGGWYHIAAYFAAEDSAIIYLDGIEQIDLSGMLTAVSFPSVDSGIGGALRILSPSSYVDGLVADLRIYDSDVSAQLPAIVAEGSALIAHSKTFLGVGIYA